MNCTIVFTVLLAFSSFALTGCEQEKKTAKVSLAVVKKYAQATVFRGCGQQ